MCPTGWLLPTAQGPDCLDRVRVVGELKREGRCVPTAQLGSTAA